MRAVFKLLLLLTSLVLAVPANADDSMTAPEALALVQAHAVALVDVRTPAEWAETGIPAGAGTVSWGQPDFVPGILALTQGDRNAPLVLICRTGNRSVRALAALRENGFTQVRHVGEGMGGSAAGPGWLARGLPVTR
ncbi:MAG: rhodanese-like domain-containing protein [Bacteroidota bacterium]